MTNLHVLPPLTYNIAGLEPYIDTRTMQLHHDQHHHGYVVALNKALEFVPELSEKSGTWLLANLNQIPEKIRVAVRFNAGGHVNHSLLWRTMSPNGGGAPIDALADAINQSFDSFENFKSRFEQAGNELTGSGWVWLVQERFGGGGLKVMTTNGHDNPVSQGYLPLLVNDVWEHAYYLKYENRRAEYLHTWWSVVHWGEVSERLAKSQQAFKSISAMNEAFFGGDVTPIKISVKA